MHSKHFEGYKQHLQCIRSEAEQKLGKKNYFIHLHSQSCHINNLIIFHGFYYPM